MRSKATILVLLVMFAGAVSAFPAELNVVDRTATIDDPAIFNLTVENNYPNTERFRISSVDSPPVASRWFDYEYSKYISSNEKGIFRIEVTPEENSIQQNYAFTLNIRSFQNEELEKIGSFFTVSNLFDLKITSFEVSSQNVDPGDTVDISATVQNTASSTLEDFRVVAEGFNRSVEREGAVLDVGDSIRYNFQLDVPEMNAPGDEKVSIKVLTEGEERQSSSQNVTVKSVENVNIESSENNKLLTRTETIKLLNEGNVDAEETVERSLPVYIDPLASFKPEPDSTETDGSQKEYVWHVDLEPGEEDKVSYTVSYLSAMAFVGLLFLGVLGFKKFQTDIQVSKTSKRQEGELKIRIELENNSSRSLDDLKLKDFVPDIAEVSPDFEMAHPKVTKTSNGTKLEWGVDMLQSGEQRVFEYTVKPLVEVEEGVKLDSAKVERNGEMLKETSKLNLEFRPE